MLIAGALEMIEENNGLASGVATQMTGGNIRSLLFAGLAALCASVGDGLAQEAKTPGAPSATAAGDIANFFGQVGDQIYEDCIFE